MAGSKKEEMGDETVTPDSNGQVEENDNEENVSEEYNMLDSKLDELNSALDFLEQKNDNIHSQLVELLNSSREIRQQMQQQNSSDNNAAPQAE